MIKFLAEIGATIPLGPATPLFSFKSMRLWVAILMCAAVTAIKMMANIMG